MESLINSLDKKTNNGFGLSNSEIINLDNNKVQSMTTKLIFEKLNT